MKYRIKNITTGVVLVGTFTNKNAAEKLVRYLEMLTLNKYEAIQ